jgi:hypothetical protein
LENYLVYISKAGAVEVNFNIGTQANQTIKKSLLGMGANMSVLTEAIKGFKLPNSWITGWGHEQFLGWHVWKNGYNLLYNPHVKVCHLLHGQSLARYVKDSRKLQLREAEVQLVFYRLYGLEEGLSVMNRICYIIIRSLTLLKNARSFYEASLSLRGLLIGNIVGCKWLILNKLGSRFDPLFELRGLFETELVCQVSDEGENCKKKGQK